MARYLLVEFDDNDSANRMRAQIDSAESAGKNFRVIGMFSKPGALCGCSTRGETSVRGKRFGWWLCRECRRPKNGSPQTLSNMLDDEDTPSMYKDLFLSLRWFNRDGRIITSRSLPKKDWK